MLKTIDAGLTRHFFLLEEAEKKEKKDKWSLKKGIFSKKGKSAQKRKKKRKKRKRGTPDSVGSPFLLGEA